MQNKYALINGIFIYSTTALLTLLFHESGHFFIEKIWGFDAVIHPNYGSYSGLATDSQKIIIAAAGPLFSLFQGLVLILFSRVFIQKNIFSLFILWLSLHGFILFFGYLVCSPFFIYGDTGQVFYLLHVPIYITASIAIASILILVRTLQKLANEFVYYGRDVININSRLNNLILYPLIFGGVFALIIQLPVPNFLLLFAGITTPLMFLIVYGKLKDNISDKATVNMNRLSIPLIIIFIATIILVRYLI
jgi:hypothetical protein